MLTIFTHGVSHGAAYGLATREEFVEDMYSADDTNSIGAFRMRRGPTYMTLRAGFVAEHFRSRNPCFLSLHACNTGGDTTLMADSSRMGKVTPYPNPLGGTLVGSRAGLDMRRPA